MFSRKGSENIVPACSAKGIGIAVSFWEFK